MWSPRIEVIVLSVGIAFPSVAVAQERVDLVLQRGKIFSSDALLSTYSAVVVNDGLIVELGRDDLIDRYLPEQAIDIEGKFVVPGFIDTHIHILSLIHI